MIVSLIRYKIHVKTTQIQRGSLSDYLGLITETSSSTVVFSGEQELLLYHAFEGLKIRLIVGSRQDPLRILCDLPRLVILLDTENVYRLPMFVSDLKFEL